MSQTQTTTWVPPGNPSQRGSAQWVYDEIMRNIEPDLITTRIVHLDEMYANETEEEGKKRMQSYEKAFEIFDAVAAQFEKDFHSGVLKLRKDAHAKAIQDERKERDQNAKNIESTFDDV